MMISYKRLPIINNIKNTTTVIGYKRLPIINNKNLTSVVNRPSYLSLMIDSKFLNIKLFFIKINLIYKTTIF
ncbi:hypothetical protein H6785_01930 [Candidatus Nomurabacteria bacterium]|nr:hypothetical protein [Candidatus Nomurabacteria bacterium]